MKRYGVEYCDEGGTLSDSEGKNIPHTWAVVDRWTKEDDGHARHIETCYTRRQARERARELNEEQP